MRIPPGPRGFQVLDFFGIGRGKSTLQFLERTARRYGPISSFRILNRRLYLVDDAELIKEILVTKQHSFERDAGAKLLRELVGDSLITREEPLHKERRRMLQPAFHGEQIANYARTMFSASQAMAAAWSNGTTLDIRAEMRGLTLEIVGAALFGTDFSTSAGEVSDVLQHVGKRSRWLAPAFVFLEPIFDAYRRKYPNSRGIFNKERQRLNQILLPVLTGIRQEPLRQNSSILHLLAREEGILDEMVTFMLAGHETTAAALTFAFYLLAKHPEIAARLWEELAQAPACLTVESVGQLPFTNMVWQESLRLFPPALAFARRAKEEVTLAGYTIPVGTSVFVSPFVTQRNPAYFEQPERFNPDRWSTYQGPKLAYFPFGAGAKMCIGDAFARWEGIIVLATLARRWCFEDCTGDATGIGPGFLLRPEKKILLKVTARVPELIN